MNVSNECPWRKMGAVNILSTKTVCNDKAADVPKSSLRKLCCVPSEVEENFERLLN
jgi:hypothetical protein